jgi:hypothetical protein
MTPIFSAIVSVRLAPFTEGSPWQDADFID